MLNIGDYTQHQKTNLLGQVVGYGHEMIEGAYLPTLKVRVIQGAGKQQGDYFEDVSSAWVQVGQDALPDSLSEVRYEVGLLA